MLKTRSELDESVFLQNSFSRIRSKCDLAMHQHLILSQLTNLNTQLVDRVATVMQDFVQLSHRRRTTKFSHQTVGGKLNRFCVFQRDICLNSDKPRRLCRKTPPGGPFLS